MEGRVGGKDEGYRIARIGELSEFTENYHNVRTISISICVTGKVRFTLYHIHPESVAAVFLFAIEPTRTIPARV